MDNQELFSLFIVICGQIGNARSSWERYKMSMKTMGIVLVFTICAYGNSSMFG